MKRVDKWFEAGEPLHWSKKMPLAERRESALASRGGDTLATARALQALANVSRDKKTATLAAADARYFFRQHRLEVS